ncbi:hypothetical protein GGI43DRAFT_406233 [Trichoderma evansii]
MECFATYLHYYDFKGIGHNQLLREIQNRFPQPPYQDDTIPNLQDTANYLTSGMTGLNPQLLRMRYLLRDLLMPARSNPNSIFPTLQTADYSLIEYSAAIIAMVALGAVLYCKEQEMGETRADNSALILSLAGGFLSIYPLEPGSLELRVTIGSTIIMKVSECPVENFRDVERVTQCCAKSMILNRLEETATFGNVILTALDLFSNFTTTY